MGTKKETLLRRLSRLESSLHKEQSRLHNVINNIGWGTGMRCTRCTPSFRREDEIRDKIRTVKTELGQMETEIGRNKLDMSKQKVHTPIKSGDLVTFNINSLAHAETYKGVVESKDQLGLVVFANGV